MFGRFVALLAGIAGAVAASQAPAFTGQYRQNLAGRVAELEIIVARFDENISRIGYDRSRALDECSVAERLLGALCDGINADIARLTTLQAHQAALNAAQPWMRPLVLAREVRPEIAQSAWDSYQPAMPTTPEGAGYAGGGFVLLYALFALLAAPFRRRPKRRFAY